MQSAFQSLCDGQYGMLLQRSARLNVYTEYFRFFSLCFCIMGGKISPLLVSQVDNFVNIASMLRRLYTRLDHPNPYHRLGAAMCAHLIYPVLRENGSIVDRHILEILFFCIKSLRVGEHDNDQIGLNDIRLSFFTFGCYVCEIFVWQSGT